MTYVVYQQALNHAHQILQEKFNYQTRETLFKIQQRFNAYAQVLHGAKGFFLSSEYVSREEFKTYVSNLRLSDNYPGFQGVGYAALIPKSELSSHIQSIRKQGFSDYRVWPASERDTYSSIIYLEPVDWRNLRAFGYDMFFEPIRNIAMSRARDTDKPALSSKVFLVQETEEGKQIGFLVYLPVYFKDKPTETEQQRRQNLQGWVYSPFRIKDFLNGLLGEQKPNLDLEIYDGETESLETLMYDEDMHLSQETQNNTPAKFSSVTRVTFMGQTWTIKLRSTPLLEAEINSTPALLIAANGSVISVLLCLLLATLINSRARALKDSEELRIAATVFESQEGMVVTDSDVRILRVNPAFCRLTGYSEEEVIGHTPKLLKSGQHDSAFYEALWQSIESNGTWEGEIWNRRKNGEVFPEYIVISSVKNQNGVVSHYVGIFRDITQNKQAESAIAANKAKSDFLANMSHEIRTPMNGIIGMVDVLLNSDLDKQQRKFVEIIRSSAYAQLGILNDILDFSKIEANKLELASEDFDIEETIENVCFTLNQMAISKGVNLTLFIDPKIPRMLHADPLRLWQILSNLTNNAIKFCSNLSYQGHVSVQAELDRIEANQVWIKFSVKDNGIGIDQVAQSRIFNQFEQADPGTTRRYGGTGLGLAISHRLVEMMNGHISLSSKPNHGATFEVLLPLGLSANQPPIETLDLQGLNCKVIGTNQVLLKQLSDQLWHAGILTQVVSPEQLSSFQNDLDLWVMVVDGTPSAAELKAIPAIRDHKNLKMLVIHHPTQCCGRRSKPRHLSDDIVQIDCNVLTRRALLNAVALAAGQPDVHFATPATPSNPILPSANRQMRSEPILVAEDNEINQSVIAQQLKLLGFDCDIAENGQAALDLWNQGSYRLLLTDLHMPKMDGYHLTSVIRSLELKTARPRTTIIALTAVALQGEAERCKNQGMDDYLSKPTPLMTLQSMLDKWIPHGEHVSQSMPAAELTVAPMLQPQKIVNAVDLSVIHEMVGNNPGVAEKFWRLYQEQATSIVAEIKDAFKEQDCVKISSLAHKLKSSSRSIGAMRLGDICQEMEHAGKLSDFAILKALENSFDTEFIAVIQEIEAALKL